MFTIIVKPISLVCSVHSSLSIAVLLFVGVLQRESLNRERGKDHEVQVGLIIICLHEQIMVMIITFYRRHLELENEKMKRQFEKVC